MRMLAFQELYSTFIPAQAVRAIMLSGTLVHCNGVVLVIAVKNVVLNPYVLALSNSHPNGIVSYVIVPKNDTVGNPNSYGSLLINRVIPDNVI